MTSGIFYDAKHNLTQRRPDYGIPDMSRTASRLSERKLDYTESCINDRKVMEAKTDLVRPRRVSLVNFKK